MAAQHNRTALDLVEEAVYLLRRAPATAFSAYYVGTLPFALAFLFFWADMGRSATASEHAAPAALGLAAMFLWMSSWQAVFAQHLRSTLTGIPPAPFRRVALLQATVQPTKLIVLPIAVLVTVPLGAVFAFYQNLMAVSYEDAGGMRQPFTSARRQANLWPMQNWIVLGLVLMLAIVVFINVGALLLLIPQLLKTLFGVETELSRSQVLMANSTFLAITAVLTYAIVDPLIKSIYVLRCFYGESIATGEDLKAQLKLIVARVALAIVALTIPIAHAQPPAHSVDRAIDDVLKRPEFSWRLPHRPAKEQKTWFTQVLNNALEKFGQWMDEFSRWLHERFRPKEEAPPGKQPPPKMQAWVYALLGLALLIFVVLFIRLFRGRSRTIAVAEPVPTALPDLASDDTSADQLPPDEWLRTARECIARNDLRLAVRALYLASLSYLGSRSLIAIDRGKSNRDYARELRRRTRAKPEILPVFNDTIGVFERSWYGMYDVDRDLVTRVETNLATMRAAVEP